MIINAEDNTTHICTMLFTICLLCISALLVQEVVCFEASTNDENNR